METSSLAPCGEFKDDRKLPGIVGHALHHAVDFGEEAPS
jgi:hypothetical protein